MARPTGKWPRSMVLEHLEVPQEELQTLSGESEVQVSLLDLLSS